MCKKGIYKIFNMLDNKFYIGSSKICIYKRYKRHLWDLRNNNHHSKYLQNAFNKYGEENFKIELLEEYNETDILKKEQHYLDTLKPHYNICKVAGNCTGRFVSEETKKKISKSLKGISNKHLFTKENIEKRAETIRKYILQYDLEGNFIKEWKGINVAAKKLKINQANISACLIGRYNKTHNFIFKYK